MKARWTFLLAAALSALPGPAGAQLVYDATTFIPGLGATASFWTRRNSIANLGQLVVLKDVRNADPYTLGSIAEQSWQVRSYWASNAPQVYAGHSLGGLVARHAAFAEPGRTAGILTVASPHRGALIADNAQVVVNYFSATIVKVADAFAHGVLGLRAGNVTDQVAHVLLEAIVTAWLRSAFPVNAPAVSDVTTVSPAVAALDRPDNFPHASVYGVIDRRLAWMKTALSAGNNDESFPTWQTVYKVAVNVFRGCAVLGLFSIVGVDRAVRCLLGSLALTRIDERWMFYTTGWSKGVEFDGLLPAATTAYPGTTLAEATNLPVKGRNHVDITWRCEGIKAMADQMVMQLGMRRGSGVADCGASGGGGGGGGGGGCVDCLLPARPGLGEGPVRRSGREAPVPGVRRPAGGAR